MEVSIRSPSTICYLVSRLSQCPVVIPLVSLFDNLTPSISLCIVFQGSDSSAINIGTAEGGWISVDCSFSTKYPMSARSTTNPEAQPLLSTSKPLTYHDELIHDPSRAAGGNDEESNDTLLSDDAHLPKTRSWSIIVFQSVIVLSSLLVVGLFIKRFIDAGDVEVWLVSSGALALSLRVAHSRSIRMS